ncbi:MBL fold metallo-hydrolase [Rhizobium ruizarguesonis]|uniref:ComEC/Rec2 family competence protein n=1 Tax=Rhizobium ruizarguesonis TaxID=2081791 RepID=UPI0010319C5E|nr:MBL fold metallo-hydrolase [Rhizobium ruizarguesonis]TAV33694.1 MBL fold metallo-hydrolase [Rhizobium ruizarguesonis]TAV38554.1 MBL fold metallo-hydrolase [Rhizobium ruizarguesonis]TAW65649.1 MBL fold metallo-hydrolase [Rhizobium ruizarguesonis]TAZ57669.1 MBL fold metallo-hydrolase [Rhizobium ruizarguesonis]
MQIRIFDVEHGGCALVTTDNGKHLLIDSGHNSTTGWRPSVYLLQQGIHSLERVIITNMDEDHASDLHRLRNTVRIDSIYRNPTVSAEAIRYLKGQDQVGPGIDALADMMTTFTDSLPAVPDLGGITFDFFWNSYPYDFEDENNLSIVCILRYPSLNVCFPGDMEVAGWRKLWERQDFRDAMSNIQVLVASHHGRMNGCCPELYEYGWKPQVTIISDSGIQYATQETRAWYRARTHGITLNNEFRRVITTRRDGRISIIATPEQAGLQVGG